MASIGKDIQKAAELLMAGEVVAIPTETVYGLAGNAMQEAAVSKIFRIKNRPKSNPLILHVSGAECLEQYAAKIPAVAFDLADCFWPGSLTMLLTKRPSVPDLVTAGLPRVGLRVPDHGLTLELLRRLPFALAAPSANPYGYISATTATHVDAMLGARLPYILDGGPCQRGIESTIVGFDQGEVVIYRKGVITADQLTRVAGKLRYFKPQSGPVQASGMALSHYAPITPILLTADFQRLDFASLPRKVGFLSFCSAVPQVESDRQIVLSVSGDLAQAASNLYGALHRMDAMDLDLIVAQYAPAEGIGVAINDRLTRAAHPKA